MTAILKVDTIQDTSGNNIINESSDTITIGASGDTIALAGTTVTGITQGITMADEWRITANTNQGTNADITSNWERIDNAGWGGIGTGLTESSGIFTFPSTGIYKIDFIGSFQITASDTACDFKLEVTTNNSSYVHSATARAGNNGSGIVNGVGSNIFLLDVTNTSTHKIKFSTATFGTDTYLRGDTDKNHSGFSVVRLGDT